MLRAAFLASSLFLAALLASSCASRPSPSPHAPPQPILRIHQLTNGSVALQVAIRDLLPSRRHHPVIRLVGVTHLGSTDYYQALQHRLDAQPLVLFEGVGATNKQFIATRNNQYALQPALARALGLRFQLDAINYSSPHFINSDLSVEELSRIFASPDPIPIAPSDPNADSPPDPPSDAPLGELLSLMDGSSWSGIFMRFGVAFISASPKLQATVRLVLIETLGSLEGDLGDATGLPPDLRRLMEILIRERNSAVLRDLSQLIDRARKSRHDRIPSLAIFYGAGHLSDLERRIRADLGYVPGPDEWLTAFDVNPRQSGLGDNEVALARRLVRDQLRSLGMRKDPK
jgi:hypothetical protein